MIVNNLNFTNMENKNQFIEILLKNYYKFNWTRVNFEYSTDIGDYHVILDSAKTGVVLRVNTTNKDGEFYQCSVYADDNESVRTIYDKVFGLWNKQREESFWNCAMMSLAEVVNR